MEPDNGTTALPALWRHMRDQGLWVFLGRVYLSGGALVSSVILARMLNPAELGTYRYAMTVIAMVAVLSLPGALQVVVRHLPKGDIAAFRRLFRLRLVTSPASAVAFASICIASFSDLGGADVLALIAITLLLPIYFSLQLYEGGLQAQMRFRKLSQVYILRTTAQLIGFLVGFGVFGGVLPALACQICFLTIFHASAFLSFARVLPPALNQPSGTPGKDAAMLSAFALLPVLTDTLDKIIVQSVSGFEVLALYSIGLTFGMGVNGFFKPFLNSLNARLVHGSPSAMQYAGVFVTGSVLGLSIASAAPHLLNLLYGPVYSDSAPIAQIVLASMGIYFLRTLYHNHATYNKFSPLPVVYKSNLVTAVVVLVYMPCVSLWLGETGWFLPGLALAYPLKMAVSVASVFTFSQVPKAHRAARPT